uniref:Uncharacterized protein n=1 Tax=Setaria italica TaxID=4555 RepID=K3XU89_SETIT
MYSKIWHCSSKQLDRGNIMHIHTTASRYYWNQIDVLKNSKP